MRRADWLVLLLAGSREGLEPVRVQKALFLLAQEAGLPPEERYAFEPYSYGPMSRAIYRDIARLVRQGVLEEVSAGAERRRRVRLTAHGRRLAGELDRDARSRRARARMQLDAIRSEVVRLSFAALLRTVYDRYPAYATRSVFRRT